MSTVRLSAVDHAAIREHGQQGFPEEICGILMGRDNDNARIVERIVPVANARSDQRARRYTIDAAALLDAERTAAAEGLEVVGFYHSHPDHPALPSEFDREHSWPWYSYVIVAIDGGEAREVRSWRLRPDRSAFEEERMVVGGSGG